MPNFNISRVHSDYPKLPRNEIAAGAIFRNYNNGMGQLSHMHVGKDGDGRLVSINLTNLTPCVAEQRQITRTIALVGNAQYKREFFSEAAHEVLSLYQSKPTAIFVVDGVVNDDKLPIVFGLLGVRDDGLYVSVDFSAPGSIRTWLGPQQVTVVGKFSIVGTEI